MIFHTDEEFLDCDCDGQTFFEWLTGKYTGIYLEGDDLQFKNWTFV